MRDRVPPRARAVFFGGTRLALPFNEQMLLCGSCPHSTNKRCRTILYIKEFIDNIINVNRYYVFIVKLVSLFNVLCVIVEQDANTITVPILTAVFSKSC
jgi:hypothetical protein